MRKTPPSTSEPTRQTRADKRRASDHRLAARLAPAPHGAHAVSRIIVGVLFSLADVLRGANPDGVADDLRVAVRLARMVDVARDVPADGRVADVQPIELEAPDVPL